MTEFYKGIESQSSGLLEISICIRGFGKFAAATKKFLGNDEVKQMIHKLFTFSEQYYSGESVTNMEDTIAHLPSFMTAFAHILYQLDEVEISYLDNLENVVGTFFFTYPQLFPYQRYEHYAALSCLLVSLSTKGAVLRTFLSRIGTLMSTLFYFLSVPWINDHVLYSEFQHGGQHHKHGKLQQRI
jgi:hypothetical protein